MISFFMRFKYCSVNQIEISYLILFIDTFIPKILSNLHFMIIKYIELKSFPFAINLNVLLSSQGFSTFDYFH